jgi:hypothetical protein
VISFDKGKEIIEKEKRPPFLFFEKIKELVSNDSIKQKTNTEFKLTV